MDSTTSIQSYADSLLPPVRSSRCHCGAVAKRCVFALIPVLTLLALAEIVARTFVSEATIARRFEQIEQIIVYLGSERGESIFEPDPNCFWRLKPGVVLPAERGTAWGGVMSNSQGLRSREILPERSTSARRVLCIGDSTTFGFGVDFADAWPNRLQELLDGEESGAFEVLNAGVPGHTSYQGRQRLEALLEKWHPQLTIITFGNNDGWRWDGLADKDHVAPAHGAALSGVPQWLNHSRAWSALLAWRNGFANRRAVANEALWAEEATMNFLTPNLSWTPRVSLGDFADNLRAMIALCRKYDCEVVLVVWPDQRQFLGQPMWRLPYQDSVREVARDTHVVCEDLVAVFEDAGPWGIDRFLRNDVIHIDPKGNCLVSQRMAEHVGRILKDDTRQADSDARDPLRN